MKSIKVNKSTFIEGSLTNSPQCVGPTHLHRRQHRESLHKAHPSAYRQEKQLPEFRQTNGKDYYVIHPIKSQKITTVCHLHWSQVTKTIINISCFGSWGPTQTRGRPKPRNRWWVLPTLSNINQSGGWMIYQLAHKTISKAPLRCSLDSQTEDVNNLMLQARVQTLLYVCPPAPAHQDTWKRDREQSLSSCGYQCSKSGEGHRNRQQLGQTLHHLTDKSYWIHRMQLHKTNPLTLLSTIQQCYPLSIVNKTSQTLAIRYPSSLEQPETAESRDPCKCSSFIFGVHEFFLLDILLFFLTAFPYFSTCFSCLFSKSFQRYSPQLLHLLPLCLQAFKSQKSSFSLWFTLLGQFWVT